MDSLALGKVLLGLVMGLLPFYEPRYLPIYFTLILHLPLKLSLILSILDCILLASLLTILISFIDKLLLSFSRSRLGFLSKLSRFYSHYKQRILRKHRKALETYGLLGLVAFIAIPLPLTGMWSGSLVSLVLEIGPKKRFLALCLGGLISLALVTLGLYLGQKVLI